MSEARSRYATSRYYSGQGEITFDPARGDIEVMARFQLRSTVRIRRGLLQPGNPELRDVYSGFGRCVAIVDDVINELYRADLDAYFAYHGLDLEALVIDGREPSKSLQTVQTILEFLGVGGCNVARDEPVLVIGGGVITDTAGLACALQHRRTPYVMVATSLVAAVDAGPSPRTCVNGDAMKNSIGAYHPPVLTLVDPGFLSSLESRHIRHGLAEIVKMGAVDDLGLFEILEQRGQALLDNRFGTAGGAGEQEFADGVLHRSLVSYLRHEGVNAFEIYQDRPHAYGHTWSPSFERSAKLLHGHAVAIDMGLSAVLAQLSDWLTAEARDRILDLCSSLGLAIYHPCLENHDLLVAGQEAMRAKRGGRALWAPVPCGAIGSVGYLEDVSSALLKEAVTVLRGCAQLRPRGGAGIDMSLTASPQARPAQPSSPGSSR